MKGLERIIFIAVFVVPIIICGVILKSIWSDEEANDNDKESSGDKISVSIDPEIVYPDTDELFSGDEITDIIGAGTTSGDDESTRLEQISKIYTDAEIKAVLADVYSTTDVTSERLGTIEKYTKVTAQKYSDGWSKVTGVDSKGINISGWVKTSNISYPSEEELNVNPTSGTGTVKADPYLNIRISPSSSAQKIGEVPNGKKVVIEESVNGWHKITYGGVTGWVSSDFVK